MANSFTRSDVHSCNKTNNLYIIIDDQVYDLTTFQHEHPGGKRILQRVSGKDASRQFWQYHGQNVLNQYQRQLCIGSLKTETSSAKARVGVSEPTVLQASKLRSSLQPYGSMIPFADPSWYQSVSSVFRKSPLRAHKGQYPSPHFDSSHATLRHEVREWVRSEIEPHVGDWEEAKEVPPPIYRQMGQRGYLAGMMGIKYPTHLTPDSVKSVSPEKWTLFHELVLTDEIARAGSGGFILNLIGGFGISCPPLIKYGNQELVERVVPSILAGDERIVLAITEPDVGSDVANLTCEAKKSLDGTHYIVNGEKKWITNGIWANYFTTAVRTGGPGLGGVSMLLVERSEGVITRRMDCQGVWASGTTYVTFEDVKVPVENLIGNENEGFKLVIENFNHERLSLIIQCLRFSRLCYEESFKHALRRETFGKKLIEHAVIRFKLANMVRQIESSYNWLENCIYQYQNMDPMDAMSSLGGPIAALKVQATQTFEFCAREASQIFGGLSYTKGGQGGMIERLYRDVRAYAIPGGSEEIMLDLSIRQSMRNYQKKDLKL